MEILQRSVFYSIELVANDDVFLIFSTFFVPD